MVTSAGGLKLFGKQKPLLLCFTYKQRQSSNFSFLFQTKSPNGRTLTLFRKLVVEHNPCFVAKNLLSILWLLLSKYVTIWRDKGGQKGEIEMFQKTIKNPTKKTLRHFLLCSTKSCLNLLRNPLQKVKILLKVGL